MFYFKIGFRNIIKNYRRSLITMISIVIGMVACLLTHGFFNWNISDMRESMIHNGIGHYQLFAEGFSKYGGDDPFKYLINDVEPILAELHRMPEAELVTTRMAFNGLLSSGEKTVVVTGEAGEPDNERKLNTYSGLINGSYLSWDHPNGLMIGDGVAKKLSAKLGDTLTLMSNMQGGGINAIDLKLVGITHKGQADLDNMLVSASLEDIKNLLYIDDSVQKVVVLLKDTGDTDKVLPRIKEICRKYKLEYKAWGSLAEFYQSLKVMYDVIFSIIILIVLAIVTFTISNTVNMNLNDRVREIGTIRALGTRRTQVALIFIAESTLIGVIGGAIGLVISYILIGFTELIGGIPVLIKGVDQPYVMHVFFHPTLLGILLCMVLFVFVAVLASVNPSRRASKISIVDALRWI
jgi:putative ABC transport system permease protein